METEKIINPERGTIINTEKRTMEKIPQVMISRTERPCSYEFGNPTKGRVKIYFDNVSDLCKQLIELKEAGIEIENNPIIKE